MTPRSEVVRDPAIMSGDLTIRGTRILAETILAYLRSNAPDEDPEGLPQPARRRDQGGRPLG